MNLKEAFELAESVHTLIVDESTHHVNFLRLECVGNQDANGNRIWAATFNTIGKGDEDWMEASEIGKYKYSARASNPADAIEQAARKVMADADQLKGSLADYEFSDKALEIFSKGNC